MEKITFVNESEPYLSAENLNQMQDNIEEAIKDTYSTEEQIIGRWIDDKLIYRKYVSGTTINNGSVTLLSNVSELINHSIQVRRSGTEQYHPTTASMVGSSEAHASPIFITESVVKLDIYNEYYGGQPFKGYIEYTKTTD